MLFFGIHGIHRKSGYVRLRPTPPDIADDDAHRGIVAQIATTGVVQQANLCGCPLHVPRGVETEPEQTLLMKSTSAYDGSGN